MVLKRAAFRCLILVLLGIRGGAAIAADPELHWLNSGLNNRDLTISPAGDLLFTTIMAPGNQSAIIVMSRKVKGEWLPLEIAPFSGRFPDIEPMFDPSGGRLFFASRRPRDDRIGEDWDLWVTTRESDGWSEPRNLGAPVNGPGDEFYPSIAANGNLYFTARRPGGVGEEDIFRAEYRDGKYVSVEVVPGGINTKAYEFNAFVTPDERFLIFSSQGREGEMGGGDLYLSRRDAHGGFGPATLLPAPINSDRLDYCPFLFEGRLYFTSQRTTPPGDVRQYESLKKWLESPGNGMGDVYSVPFDPESIR